jgi:hypothetical protein
MEKSQRDQYFKGVLEILIEEYKNVRAEINGQQEYKARLALASLVTIGVSATLVYQADDKDVSLLLLIIPIFFFLMGMTYLGYIGQSYRNMIYIEDFLRPQITELFIEVFKRKDIELLNWQNKIRERKLRWLSFPISFEPLLFLVPSVGSLILFFVRKEGQSLGVSGLEWGLVFIGCLLIGVLIYFYFYFSRTGIRQVLQTSHKERLEGK